MAILGSVISHWQTILPCGLLLSVIGLFALYWSQTDSRLKKIDGPSNKLGLELPPDALTKFREWATEYGEIFKIQVGWYPWVVLNSPTAIKEVFDKQSRATSSKLPAPMSELVVGGRRMPTMPYGPKWRSYRTIVHRILNTRVAQSFMPFQHQEVAVLLHDLAHNNENGTEHYEHIHRAIFSILMKIVYGKRVDNKDDEDIKFTAESHKLLTKIVKPGNYIEDMYPFLAKLPTWLQPSRRRALRDADWVLWVKMRMWNSLKDQFSSGKVPECYAAEMLQQGWEEQGLRDEDLAWLAGGIVDAGSATSTSTFHNLMLYMTAHPEVQEKAHNELQSVIGDSRVPEIDDISQLPYVWACVKEILRICPMPPWSIRHFTDEDVVYKGTVIPKDTAIVCNTMALHFDAERYPEPFAFKPERYINHTKSAGEYAATSDPFDRDHFTFGAGRRICPGTRMAETNLALALANVLWAFEIRPPTVSVNGKLQDGEVDVSDDAFDAYPLKHAKLFKARFLVRSEQKLRVIDENWAKARI